MSRVVWSNSARDEFRQAIQFIAQDDPSAAELVRRRIFRTTELLAERRLGHPGRVAGTFEKLVLRTSYILAYAVVDDTITILHLIHSHRHWPQGTWPSDEP